MKKLSPTLVKVKRDLLDRCSSFLKKASSLLNMMDSANHNIRSQKQEMFLLKIRMKFNQTFPKIYFTLSPYLLKQRDSYFENLDYGLKVPSQKDLKSFFSVVQAMQEDPEIQVPLISKRQWADLLKLQDRYFKSLTMAKKAFRYRDFFVVSVYDDYDFDRFLKREFGFISHRRHHLYEGEDINLNVNDDGMDTDYIFSGEYSVLEQLREEILDSGYEVYKINEDPH